MSVCSTELLNYDNMTDAQIEQFTGILKNQGLTNITLRLPVYSGQVSAAYVSVSKKLIAAANGKGIKSNVDFHTWNKTANETANPFTWSGRSADYGTAVSAFCEAATNHAQIRANYEQLLKTYVPVFDVDGVQAFHILNEPQYKKATQGENQWILKIIALVHGLTAKPISIRFMGGATPTSGHYEPAIDEATDFLCANVYGTAPNFSYGVTVDKLLARIARAKSLNREIWITEFGDKSTDQTAQANSIKTTLAYFKEKGINRASCFASQPSRTGEPYNIFSGFTPKKAFYELKTDSPIEPPIPDPDPEPDPNPEPEPDTPYLPLAVLIVGVTVLTALVLKGSVKK